MTNATHIRVWEDIPWYVNGTLEEAAAAELEAHASGCQLCQSEIAAQRRIADAMLETSLLEQNASAAWTSIEARLGSNVQPQSAGLQQKLMNWISGLRNALVPMGALASIAAAILVIGVAWQGPSVYRTLTAPAVLEAEEYRLRAVPGTDHSALLSELEAAGFVIVSEEGPESVIRLSAPQPRSDREAAISALKNDARIALIAGASQ